MSDQAPKNFPAKESIPRPDNVKVGFTGSREGMSPSQLAAVADILQEPWVIELHHGDCVGSDANAHIIAVKLGLKVVIHPPVDPHLRANCQSEHTLPRAPYLVRNRHIVEATDWLIATPKAGPNRQGGTWYTIRYAFQQNKRVTIVWPDGQITTTEESD